MSTQKVAITVPTELLTIIDDISKQKGISRSRFISTVLQQKILAEKQRQIKDAYDRVFSNHEIQKEQIETAAWFEGTGTKEGQEW
jgi:metal-responsive CopG/Arc/MetJ family transcriptional regulator